MSAVRRRLAVITGGAGFIGSRLVLELATRGFEVRVLDLVEPHRDSQSLFASARCDITARHELRGAFDGAELVIHCAAQLAIAFDTELSRAFATNVEGTANVVGELIASGFGGTFIFLSTGGVYSAEDAAYPVDETTKLSPRSAYARSKLLGESMVSAAAAVAGFKALVFRLFTVYGPGPASGARGHFVASWLERIARGQGLTLHGDGRQTVDLTHVSDVAYGVAQATALRLQPGECRTYNLGGGHETSILELAQLIRTAIPSVAVEHVTAPRAFPQRQFADSNRALRDFGYQPRVDPRSGICALLSAAEARLV